MRPYEKCQDDTGWKEIKDQRVITKYQSWLLTAAVIIFIVNGLIDLSFAILLWR